MQGQLSASDVYPWPESVFCPGPLTNHILVYFLFFSCYWFGFGFIETGYHSVCNHSCSGILGMNCLTSQLVTAHVTTPPHLCHLLSWCFFPRPARYARCCCQTNVVSVHTSGFMPTSPPTAARSVVSSVALPTSRLT